MTENLTWPLDLALGVGEYTLRTQGVGILYAGTKGHDKIVGTRFADIIYGLRGNDTLTGRGGDDTIYGGEGNDVISCGNGKDKVLAGDGGDTVYVGSRTKSVDLGKNDGATDQIALGEDSFRFRVRSLEDLDVIFVHSSHGEFTLVEVQGRYEATFESGSKITFIGPMSADVILDSIQSYTWG